MTRKQRRYIIKINRGRPVHFDRAVKTLAQTQRIMRNSHSPASDYGKKRKDARGSPFRALFVISSSSRGASFGLGGASKYRYTYR